MARRTMNTEEFARLPLAERKRLVSQGWDILRIEEGKWQRRKPVIGRGGVRSFQVSEIVEANRNTYGSYKRRGEQMMRGIPKGTRGRFVKFSGTGAVMAKRGWPELDVVKKHFKVLRKEYRITTAVWGKKR